MNYEIISLGDAQLLIQALEGVAMLTGGDDFQTMIKTGLLIGLIFGFAKAVITTRTDFFPMIVGFLVYTIMFMPKVTVHVVDSYGDLPTLLCESNQAGVDSATPGSGARCEGLEGTGAVIAVDNVPVGVAFPYYLASQFGFFVSEKYNQVFGWPDMFQKGDGYLNGVRILAKLHDFDGGTRETGDGRFTVATLREQIALYYQFCTVPDIEAGKKSFAEIQKSTDLLAAITSTNVNYDVKNLFSTSAANDQKSCADMGNLLREKAEDANYSDAMKAALPIKGAGTSEGLDTAIQDLYKTVEVDSKALVRNLMIANSVKCAATGVPPSSCVAITQASNQRQQAWAAEQSLFKQVMRPMMAFIELFSLAATPIMAFLIASGFGLQLASKYFQLMAWVSLWPATMSICNVYIYSAANRALMSSLPNPGNTSSFLSMVGMESMFTTSADWVSVGSMLASATPVLTFFLVTGSSNAFQSLAGKLNGSSQLNDKVMAPDLFSPSADAQSQSGTSVMGGNAMNNLQNKFFQGAAGQMTLSGSSMASEGSQLADTLSTQGQTSLQAATAKNFGYTESGGIDLAKTAAVGRQVRQGLDKTSQAASNVADTVGSQFNFSQTQKDALTALVNASAGMGTGGLPFLQAGIKAIAASQKGNETSEAKQLTDQVSSAVQKGMSVQGINSNMATNDTARNYAAKASQTANAEAKEGFTSASTLLDQAATIKTATQAFTNQGGTGFQNTVSGTVQGFANAVHGGNSKAASDDIINRMSAAGVNQKDAQDHANRLGVSGPGALAAGYLAAGAASGQSNQLQALMGVVSQTQAGVGSGNIPNTSRVPSPQSISQQTGAELESARVATAGVESQTAAAQEDLNQKGKPMVEGANSSIEANQQAGKLTTPQNLGGTLAPPPKGKGGGKPTVDANGFPILPEKAVQAVEANAAKNNQAVRQRHNKSTVGGNAEQFKANAQQNFASGAGDAGGMASTIPAAAHQAVEKAVMESDMTPTQKALAMTAVDVGAAAAGLAVGGVAAKGAGVAAKGAGKLISKGAEVMQKGDEIVIAAGRKTAEVAKKVATQSPGRTAQEIKGAVNNATYKPQSGMGGSGAAGNNGVATSSATKQTPITPPTAPDNTGLMMGSAPSIPNKIINR